jgi:diguanylate cyclase (GGDEF)-like protein
MKKKDLPPAGAVPVENRNGPRGRESFLRGLWQRAFGPRPEAEFTLSPNGATQKTYARPFVEDLLGRIRKQHAQIDFLKKTLRASSDAVVVAEPDGTITMFNAGAEQLFEIDESMAMSDNLFRLCADSSPDGDRIGRMLIEDRRIANMRVDIAGLAGKRTNALLTIDFVKDADEKEAVAIIAVIKDVSALEEAHAKLKEAYDKVEKLSLTDTLTGLHNRRHFDKEIADEHERMKRGHSKEVSLLFIDVDHFKRFNDEHGHQVGDQVLRIVAQAIKDAARKIDIPCRYGGEEMAVILPSTDERGAWALAERIRRKVEKLEVPVSGERPAKVTCSIGVVTHRQDSGDVGMFIHEADQAVYEAKQTGRNKTVVWRAAAA